MGDKKEQSLVFEYEPQSFIVTLLKALLLILPFAAGAFYGGYAFRTEEVKKELETLASARKEAAGSKAAAEKAEQALKAIKAENEKLAQGSAGFTKLKAELEKKIADQGKAIETLKKTEAAHNALVKEHETLQKAMTALKKQRDALIAETGNQKKEIAALKTALAKANTDCKKLEDIRKQSIAKMEELTKEVNAQKKQIEGLEQDKKEQKVELDKTLRKMEYYQKQYEKIIAKYDEIRDEYLEKNPEQNAITWMESQLFVHPEGKYKILLEINKQQGNYLDFEIGVYSKRKFFPKFQMSFYNEKGGKLKRVITVDESATGYAAGRIVFFNQGWRAAEDNLPKYLKIDFLK